MPNASPVTALLGAYERDNFGDVLFLQLTRELLPAASTLVTAPFGGIAGYRPLGLDVEPLAAATRDHAVDAIWMVGGEVGGTSVAEAYRMAAKESALATMAARPRRARLRSLERELGRSTHSSPYLPRMSASPATLRTQFVINSAGLSGLNGLVGHRADEAWGAIREADFVSVRDELSSRVLAGRAIAHRLAPDLVHALRTTHRQWTSKTDDSTPYALIQVKGAVLQRFGTDQFARVLATSTALRPFSLRLFVAGSARGHDSIGLYREVVSALARMAPGRDITIVENAEPLEKARLIAQAGLWVGTSLHGLIISSSFEVPRVGLALDKLTRYATTWDEGMPVGVALSDLDAAVDLARSTREVEDRAEELARAALGSLDAARSLLDEPLSPSDIEARTASAKRLRRRAASPLRSFATHAAENAREWRRR